MQPIFSDNFLSHYISDFRLSSVTDVRGKSLIIRALADELETGKLQSLKEEEIKSRFLNQFFGEVLGFSYGTSRNWMLREEKKSVVDGTKPDTALGYFSIDKMDDDVRVVIEIKDANTSLDQKQRRQNNQTPVEQAFSYASKMGGNCKWVIVSNIKETRIYPSLDASRFQLFQLKDLVNETKLKELLFLFHKDRFIKLTGDSQTDLLFQKSKISQFNDDKAIHIIDRLYNSLKRFETLGFVDPNYIANISPFNILSEHVWQYENGNLLSLNSEIYDLLIGINIQESEITINDALLPKLVEKNVLEFKYKINWSFRFLNHCSIGEISAIKNYKQISNKNKKTIGFSYRSHFHFKEGEEGTTKNIWMFKNTTCDCLSCNYRTLDFNKLLGKLKAGFGNEQYNNREYAYGNYLVATNNFKTTYTIYKSVEKDVSGKQGKGVEYFLIKQNIKYLHNLISDYEYEDSVEILNDIKSVDLDKVIYDEIEFDIDKEVKDYLIKIKEDDLIHKLQDEIEDITFQIEKLKTLYEGGGNQFSGPNLSERLKQQYDLLYLHVNANYILYDAFKRYKSLTEKVFKGLVNSFLTPEWGLKKFNEFILTEVILHVPPSSIKDILKVVVKLEATDECVSKLLEKVNNFTTSYYKDGLFSDPYKNTLVVEQLYNYRFKYNFTAIFSNLFIVLSRLNILKDQFDKIKTPLIKFLEIEDELAWHNLEDLSIFINVKGHLFEENDLMELLKISVNGNRYGYSKYNGLVKHIPMALLKFYPSFRINNKKIINTAILSCCSDDGENFNYMPVVHLLKVSDNNCKQLLQNVFEQQLDESFNAEFYEEILRTGEYDSNRKNYFLVYSQYVNNLRGGGSHPYGKHKLTDVVFINYVLLVYFLKIDFKRNELKIFTKLNEFETWLLSPIDYEYNFFNAHWLIDLKNTIIIDRIKNNPNIAKAIEVELKREFHPDLCELKYKFFTQE
ncbi:MAG TPA: hypothetical protein VF622_00920 [Segetibacter sp.]|jgi:hypothetical protein